jgi:hypothetical protein
LAVSSGVLLEREGELGVLAGLFDGMDSSGGRTVLIRGEAGIGKTALVREFIDRQSNRAQAAVPTPAGGIGYRASSDLSSSGTWILITATPTAMLAGEDSPEDHFWQFTERLPSGSEALVQEPVAINTSGLNGYSYELSGGKGEKTGRELGGFFAILFGDKYTYQVIIQFYIPDRKEMKALFQEALSCLTLLSDDDYS